MRKFIQWYNIYKRILNLLGVPILLLIIRLYMANIFWKSGLVKISSWPSTLYLFANEYGVPIFSPEIVAYIATSIELTAPIFLTLGFLTRIAAIPMFIMAIFIEVTFMHLDIHYFWMISLATLMVFGSGAISLDRGLYFFIQEKNKS